MVNKLKKSGQKITKRLSRFSRNASKDGKAHIRENFVDRISHIRDVRLLVLEWVLLVIVIILLASVQAFWYSDSYSLSSYKAGGTYTEATLGEINSLNPLFASTNSEKVLAKLLFASLTENDYSGHSGYGLAESITADQAGKVWTVRLRDELKWSDGEPLTNSDVLFTVGLIKNNSIQTTYSSSLSGVTATENESGEIVFTLASAYVDFGSALNFPILPEHILKDVNPKLLLEADFSKNPVSSGAFIFNASQPVNNSGEMIVYLSANQNFYKGKPMLSSFAIHTFLDNDSIISALNSGVITATAELSAKDAPKISSEKIYERRTSINSGVFAFLNTSSSTLSNKKLRQAIQQGVNTNFLREISGSNSALKYPIISSQAELSNWPSLPEYNLAAARNIVSEAGIDSESKPLSIVTVNEGFLPEVAEAFSEQLRDLGFNAEVTTYDPSQDFIVNVVGARAYDIFIYEVELGSEPDLFSYYHSSQSSSSGLNFSNYNSSIANDLILAGRSTMDSDLRNAKYASFLRYWITDVPAVALYQSDLSYFYNKNVRIFSEDTKIVSPIDRFSEINYWAVEKTSLNRTP